MSTLTIDISYLALLHSDPGLTVLLPSSGHDASLTVGSVSIPLRSTDITLLKNGEAVHRSGPMEATSTEGFLWVDDLMRFSGAPENAGIKPRAEMLNSPMAQLTELNARVALPAGQLTPIGDPEELFKFRDGKNATLGLAAETIRYTTDIDPTAVYHLELRGPLGNTLIEVAHGVTITIANADRPTWNESSPPWYEIRYLLDLLTPNAPMSYLYPTMPPDAGASPEIKPCGSLATGPIIWPKLPHQSARA